MSRQQLIAVIGAAILAVGAIGAVTAIVLVKDEGPSYGVRIDAGPARVAPGQLPPLLVPAPGRNFGPGAGPPQLRKFRQCLQALGRRGAPPELRGMRRAEPKLCRDVLPAPLPGR